MSRPDRDWDQLFAVLKEQPLQIALVCTGGGTGALARCFRRPGASKNFVEAVVPYSRAAAADYLGRTPGREMSHASPEFAQVLATTAHQRAGRLSDQPTTLAAGVALAAALPTVGQLVDELRIHVAVETAHHQQSWSETASGHGHNRESAEDLADGLMFDALRSLIDAIN